MQGFQTGSESKIVVGGVHVSLSRGMVTDMQTKCKKLKVITIAVVIKLQRNCKGLQSFSAVIKIIIVIIKSEVIVIIIDYIQM